MERLSSKTTHSPESQRQLRPRLSERIIVQEVRRGPPAMGRVRSGNSVWSSRLALSCVQCSCCSRPASSAGCCFAGYGRARGSAEVAGSAGRCSSAVRRGDRPNHW